MNGLIKTIGSSGKKGRKEERNPKKQHKETMLLSSWALLLVGGEGLERLSNNSTLRVPVDLGRTDKEPKADFSVWMLVLCYLGNVGSPEHYLALSCSLT